MNRRFDLHILGWLAGLVACFLLVPVLAAVLFAEPFLPYLTSAGIAAGISAIQVLAFRTRDRRIRPRDGFLVVSGGWVLSSLLATLPYLLTGTLGPADAIFE